MNKKIYAATGNSIFSMLYWLRAGDRFADLDIFGFSFRNEFYAYGNSQYEAGRCDSFGRLL